MSDSDTRKAENKQEIEEAQEELNALLDERTHLNDRRVEAVEQDNAALSEAHDEYMEAARSGKKASKPVAVYTHRAEVEARAQQIPVALDEARLRIARAKLKLVRLERSEAIAAQERPRQMRDSLNEEIAKLSEERDAWQADIDAPARREQEAQSEEAALHMEISNLEKSVKARVRKPPNFGQIAG